MAIQKEASSPDTVVIGMSVPSSDRPTTADMTAIVAPLEVDRPLRDALVEQLRRLAEAYWGRDFVDQRFAGHGESLGLLAKIEHGAAAIIQALERIQPDFLAALEICRNRAVDAEQPTARLPLLQLQHELASWASMIADLRTKVSPRAAHRPMRSPLHFVVEHLVSGLDQQGIAVKPSRSLNSEYHLRLTGAGGELITRFFARIDPQVTPAALYRVVTAIQKAQKSSRPRTGKSPASPT